MISVIHPVLPNNTFAHHPSIQGSHFYPPPPAPLVESMISYRRGYTHHVMGSWQQQQSAVTNNNNRSLSRSYSAKAGGKLSSSAEKPQQQQQKKDFSKPLFVDCSIEYELPNAPKIPKNSLPILMIHPGYLKKKAAQQQQQSVLRSCSLPNCQCKLKAGSKRSYNSMSNNNNNNSDFYQQHLRQQQQQQMPTSVQKNLPGGMSTFPM